MAEVHLEHESNNPKLKDTETNIFAQYPSKNISQVYIESTLPNTVTSSRFFQLSEVRLLKGILNRNIIVGKEVKSTSIKETSSLDAKDEKRVFDFVRKNRWFFFELLREILWLRNSWRSEKLTLFIAQNKTDVLFCFGSPLIFMCRLQWFLIKSTNLPYCYYLMDDTITKKAITGQSYLRKIYRQILIKKVSALILNASEVFVVSEKMKREVDKKYNIKSTILTKSVSETTRVMKQYKDDDILKFVYVGQLLYGRRDTLVELSLAIKKLNEGGKKVELHIYTNNEIGKDTLRILNDCDNSFVHESVPYEEVSVVLTNHDVLVFIEGTSEKTKSIARLSFSTKITDYLEANRPIFAIGPEASSPISYLKENQAAIVVDSIENISTSLFYIVENRKQLSFYAEKAYRIGKIKHGKTLMLSRLVNGLLKANQKIN